MAFSAEVMSTARRPRGRPAAQQEQATPVVRHTRKKRFRVRSVMVLAGDVWMHAGLCDAVRELAPSALCRPDEAPRAPLSALVVWLPALQEGLPEAVRRLSHHLSLCDEDTTVLLLAREMPGWLYRTLKNLDPQNHALLCRVQCLPDRIAARQLQMALRGENTEGAALLREQEGQQPGLSCAELRALEATLRGEDVHAMAQHAHSTVSVQHRLRWQAMQKVGGLRVKNLLHPFRRRW